MHATMYDVCVCVWASMSVRCCVRCLGNYVIEKQAVFVCVSLCVVVEILSRIYNCVLACSRAYVCAAYIVFVCLCVRASCERVCVCVDNTRDCTQLGFIEKFIDTATQCASKRACTVQKYAHTPRWWECTRAPMNYLIGCFVFSVSVFVVVGYLCFASSCL